MYPPQDPSATMVGPAIGGASPAAAPLQLSPEDLVAWWTRIELARQRRKKESDHWRTLFKAYCPPSSPTTDDINSNIHFRNIHLKCAEMWAQLPELHLTPLEPLEGIPNPADPTGRAMLPAEDIVAVKRAVLNKELGPDGANVDHTIQEALFDIFGTSGIAATKICYESNTQPTPIQMPGPTTTMPGAVLGLQQVAGATVTQMVPVVVYERFRWYRFSPEKLLIPHDWHSTDFDESPWLAMEFVERLTPQARERYGLPEDFVGNVSADDMLITGGEKDPGQGARDLLKGVEIWLRASEYDDQVAHSQIYRRLVLIEGRKDDAAVYEASPYQSLDQSGRLTADSMIGNPIHPIVLRVMSDTAWVLADAAFTDPLVKQENTWAKQDIQLRDANIPRFLYDDEILEAIDKLKNADLGQGAGVAASKLVQGIDKLIAQLPHLEHSQSDVQGRQHLKRAIDETLGLGANQAGALNSTVRSATETAIVQQNVSVRLKGERNILLRRFLMGVRKFDALLQRYLDARGYVEILGQNGARRLQAFNPQVLSGRYAYDAKIDTQLANDPEKRIKNVFDFVNFMAKSPFMDQQELARLVTSECGYDPAHLVKPPPPPSPEKPNISFRFSGADLGIPEVRLILGGAGIKLPPLPSPEATQATVQAMQAQAAKTAPHGGAADKGELVSQHHGSESGQRPGAPVPSGPPAAHPPGMVQ